MSQLRLGDFSCVQTRSILPGSNDSLSEPGLRAQIISSLPYRTLGGAQKEFLGATMVLIQLLLPTRGAANADSPAPLAETRRELADRFTGVTAYVRSPAKGLWTAPDGQIEQDDVVMVEVVTETFDRAWWRRYVARLAERFRQESIHLRALPVELLDDGNR